MAKFQIPKQISTQFAITLLNIRCRQNFNLKHM